MTRGEDDDDKQGEDDDDEQGEYKDDEQGQYDDNEQGENGDEEEGRRNEEEGQQQLSRALPALLISFKISFYVCRYNPKGGVPWEYIYILLESSCEVPLAMKNIR